MGDVFKVAVGATVTMVVVYLFVFNSRGTSEIINSGASGWAKLVTAFQGRG